MTFVLEDNIHGRKSGITLLYANIGSKNSVQILIFIHEAFAGRNRCLDNLGNRNDANRFYKEREIIRIALFIRKIAALNFHRIKLTFQFSATSLIERRRIDDFLIRHEPLIEDGFDMLGIVIPRVFIRTLTHRTPPNILRARAYRGLRLQRNTLIRRRRVPLRSQPCN